MNTGRRGPGSGGTRGPASEFALSPQSTERPLTAPGRRPAVLSEGSEGVCGRGQWLRPGRWAGAAVWITQGELLASGNSDRMKEKQMEDFSGLVTLL